MGAPIGSPGRPDPPMPESIDGERLSVRVHHAERAKTRHRHICSRGRNCRRRGGGWCRGGSNCAGNRCWLSRCVGHHFCIDRRRSRGAGIALILIGRLNRRWCNWCGGIRQSCRSRDRGRGVILLKRGLKNGALNRSLHRRKLCIRRWEQRLQNSLLDHLLHHRILNCRLLCLKYGRA